MSDPTDTRTDADTRRARVADAFGQVLALDDAGIDRLEAAAERVARGGLEAVAAPGTRMVGTTLVVPVAGVLARRANWISDALGWTTLEGLAATVRAADADPAVERIVLDVDSPGGSVAGAPETARVIAAATTPTVAHTGDVCASGALWLAAACDRITATESALVGSLGVRSFHREREPGDVTSANAPRKLPEREDVQRLVDAAEALFLRDVAAGRGVSVETAAARFGRGAVLDAAAALDAGLIDALETLEETLGAAPTLNRANTAPGAPMDPNDNTDPADAPVDDAPTDTDEHDRAASAAYLAGALAAFGEPGPGDERPDDDESDAPPLAASAEPAAPAPAPVAAAPAPSAPVAAAPSTSELMAAERTRVASIMRAGAELPQSVAAAAVEHGIAADAFAAIVAALPEPAPAPAAPTGPSPFARTAAAGNPRIASEGDFRAARGLDPTGDDAVADEASGAYLRGAASAYAKIGDASSAA